ncbi:MAG: cellulase family glycosylhydrolase [Chloroflexota bacterium]
MRQLVPVFCLAVAVLTAACSAPARQPSAPRPTATPRASTAATVPPIPSPAAEAKIFTNGKSAPASAGVHVFLWGNEATTARDLKLAKDAGFTWVKQRFEWRNIEKTRKNAFEWNEPDRIVTAVNAAGLGLIARIDNQPDWARRDKIFPAVGPPDKTEDWKDFVQSLAERYRGKIQAYEVWNEPNLSREWGNAKPDAKAYVDLLKVTYTEIKKLDKDAVVISAGLSPTTEVSDRAISDVQYLKDMYAAGLKGNYDLLGVHAPGFKAAPDMDPADVAKSAELTNNDPSAADAKRVYSFRHAQDLRQIMEQNGDTDKQVAVLEMGWTADPRPNSPYRWHSVTEEQKGEYLVKALQYAKQNWAAWMGPMTILYIPDPSWSASDEQYYWSITNPDGTPRASYNALKARPR